MAKSGKQLSDLEKVLAFWPDNDVIRNDMLDILLRAVSFDIVEGEYEVKLRRVPEKSDMRTPTCWNFGLGRACSIGWTLLAAFFVTGSIGQAADARPNILFLLTDDQRADTLGCVGHPVIQTPNLDHLAADGVLLTRAFVTDPTCKPSGP